MCQSDHLMRLCTCDAEIIDKDYMWLLYSHEYKIVVGKYLPAEPSPIMSLEALIRLPWWILLFVMSLLLDSVLKFKKPQKADISKRILGKNNKFPRDALKMQDDLNEDLVFDFDYKPKSDDILVICLKGQQYTFVRGNVVKNGKFFSVWRIVDFQNYIDGHFLCDLEAYLGDKINTRANAGEIYDAAIDVKKGEIKIG